MSDRIIRISQLPESTRLLPTDYMVVENEDDTWKVQFNIFLDFINNTVSQNITQNVTNVVDDKISEVQLQINNSTSIINRLENNVIAFENEEKTRQDQEEQRIQNEAIRENTFKEIKKIIHDLNESNEDRNEAFDNLSKNWATMTATWNDWTTAESQRVANENERKQAEINRGTAETQRINAETQRVQAETNRAAEETKRVSGFSDMTDYFNNLKTSVNNCIREGSSNTTANYIIEVMRISLPSTNNGYEALIHLVNGSAINTLIALEVANNSIKMAIPKNKLEQVKRGDGTCFNAFYVNNGNTIEVSIQCWCKETTKIKTAILWDNISIYKPNDGTSIYAKASKNQTAKAASDTSGFNGTIPVTIVTSTNNAPESIINMIDAIDKQIQDIVKNVDVTIKPIDAYPIGSVYTTTSASNPSTLLGGGTWEKMYNNNSITSKLSVNNTDTKAYTLHYWVRTA